VSLFEPDLPEGFLYEPDFISADEARTLVAAVGQVHFADFSMRGVVARRRVAFFGASYSSGQEALGPIPDFLLGVRAKAAAWAGVPPAAFAMALINEYTPGATIGWHRDAPQYGIVAGVSLLSACRMKLRPYVLPSAGRQSGRAVPRKTTHEIVLEPRSGYLLTGVSRGEYEHSIPATPSLRYSITFRTLRR
jgi:alkylated DNA repair dioxygenase AlkB